MKRLSNFSDASPRQDLIYRKKESRGQKGKHIITFEQYDKISLQKVYEAARLPPALTHVRYFTSPHGLILSSLILKKSISYLYIYIHTDKIGVCIYIFLSAGLLLISVFFSTWVVFFPTCCVLEI